MEYLIELVGPAVASAIFSYAIALFFSSGKPKNSIANSHLRDRAMEQSIALEESGMDPKEVAELIPMPPVLINSYHGEFDGEDGPLFLLAKLRSWIFSDWEFRPLFEPENNGLQGFVNNVLYWMATRGQQHLQEGFVCRWCSPFALSIVFCALLPTLNWKHWIFSVVLAFSLNTMYLNFRGE